MNQTEMDTFLDRARYAVLTTIRKDGSPNALPVWFEWDGEVCRIFSEAGASKLHRIANEPRVSVLVSNDVTEPEAWVAFDGVAEVSETGGFELAERLAPMYWNLDDPDVAATLAEWRDAAEHFRLISIRPTAIRSYP